jgi:hypothetical protein
MRWLRSDLVAETNLTKVDDYQIYITSTNYSSGIWGGYAKSKRENSKRVPFTKYQIKESDFRAKTASFTSPMNIDLTGGRVLVRITSTKHENFNGVILDDDYTENKDGTYTYKCQDMSRQYMSKFQMISTKQTNHRILKSLVTALNLGITDKITDEFKEGWKENLSGIRPLYKYAGSYMGNPVSLNMMAQKPKLISKNKSFMEVIRNICHANAYVDVFFDSNGVLQIKPININDWKQTGLHLDLSEVSERQFKFDITNAVTNVIVDSTSANSVGKNYKSRSIIGLNLPAFFGINATETSNPSQSSSGSSTTKAVTSTKTTTKTSASSSGKNGNPFNNKKKKILVSADKGSCPFKAKIVSMLKKDGWSVTEIKDCYGDAHSKSYRMLDSSYAVNLTIYNGMCAGTIKEVYDGWLKNKHPKLGVALVNMWDTHSWTSKKGKNNPKGDWYHRNGDMSDYYLATAHDWNRGTSPVIKSVSAYFKKYKVLYCCGPTAAQAYAQFKAGGYAKMKGLY